MGADAWRDWLKSRRSTFAGFASQRAIIVKSKSVKTLAVTHRPHNERT